MFGKRSTTPAEPETRDERAERLHREHQAEDRRIAQIERAVSEDLRARVRAAAHENEDAPLDAAAVRNRLLPTFRAALEAGERRLQDQLADEGLDYDTPRLTAEYQHRGDAWERAVAAFRLPLAASDATALAETLEHSVVAQLVGSLVDGAVQDRLAAQIHAQKWLAGWARSRRGLPMDATDAEADALDERVFAKQQAEQAKAPKEAPTLTVTPAYEQTGEFAGGNGRIYEVRYPVPTESDD